jgi:DNA-binding MarR family transcriptional regulator
MDNGSPSDELALQRAIQELVRGLGLLDATQTPCGVPMPTSYAHALQVLGEGRCITQHALAGRLRLDKSTVSRMISALVDRCLVERATNPENRREALLSLTADGVRALGELQASARARHAALLERIPADKRGMVVDALRTLAAASREVQAAG